MRRFSKAVLTLGLAALTLTACTKPDHKQDSGEATFVVKSVSGYAQRGTISEGLAWKVPTSVTVGFEACLQDRASRTDLRNQAFRVEIPGSTKGFDVRTTPYGCLHWTEDMPFNYYAGHSGWVTLVREIVGREVNTGRRPIEVAVNPWAVGDHARDAAKAVVFLRDSADGFIPAPLYSAAQSEAVLGGELKDQGGAQLIVQNVKIRAVPQAEGADGVELKYIVEMEPKIRTFKANGDYNYDKVPDGDFNVWAQALATHIGPKMDQTALLLGGQPFKVGKVIDGTLRVELVIRQEKRANQGSLQLALKVQPRSIGASATVKPFNGLYELGSGLVLGDGGGPVQNVCLEDGDKCDFAKIVQSANNYKDTAGAKYLLSNQRYIFSNIRLRFLMILPGETATQRTVSYTASTCITDMQTGKPLSNTPMVIRHLEQDQTELRVISQTTDASGCLNWDGVVFHKYYEPEEYFERVVSIEKASGFKQQFTYYVNPWDNNINFGFDSREFTPAMIEGIRKREKVPSRFFLGDFSYHTVRFLYNIDPFMELEVKKTVLMELTPKVLRYSGIKDARKMTERLRDGIYLMKIAIQKSYLDPRDNSRWLLKDNPNMQAEMQSMGGEKLATKKYITSNLALVRVVDGMIIYPMELTMHDLRLMRVRSNFMVEFQTVDERLIQAFHVFKRHAISAEDLESKLKAFKEKLKDGESLDDVNKMLGAKETDPALDDLVRERNRMATSPDLRQAYDDLENRVRETQNIVASSLEFLTKRLQSGGELGTYLKSDGKDTRMKAEILKDANITDNFQLNESMLDELRAALTVNDFSRVSLPTKEEVDLNLFIEPNSGLKKRSFVGPVIFLSNAYSDSVRATDNLDEANCSDDGEHPKDALRRSKEELQLNLFEKSLVLHGDQNDDGTRSISEDSLKGNRQNNAYQYSQFFGALTHLCYKNVDDLMDEEKTLRLHSQDQLVAASLKSNFIKSYPFDMDYVSLTDEPLLKVKDGCDQNLNKCLEVTHESTLPAAALKGLINDDLGNAAEISNTDTHNIIKRFRGVPFRSERAGWEPADYGHLFFERSIDAKVGLCNLLSNKLGVELTAQKLSLVSRYVIHEKIMQACAADGGLIHDIKFHVEQTGNYMFLGGLNLNINVGESFSMGWSRSWSAGLELSDFVGALAGMGSGVGKVAGGFMIKPMSIKMGTSLSNSTGTNISESTYLVSQIAKFSLDLLAYEKCSVIRLSDQAVNQLARSWGDSRFTRAIGLSTANFEDPRVERAFKRGLMVCEGSTAKNNPPKRVEEMYFYFTQHFTEGDMLDQADLYNHPWLLGMRGMRDFAVFVDKIRAQEVVSAGTFASGLLGFTEARPHGWALEHMSGVYADVLPSFPGYYTVLDPNEDLTAFLLQQSRKFSKVDLDPLGEVTHRTLGGN